MADLVRPGMGGGSSSLVSGSFWFNTPYNGAQILDCSGMFYDGFYGITHNTPSQEDSDYPSLQIQTAGAAGRKLFVITGNPSEMDNFRVRYIETNGAGGGFDGATYIEPESNTTGIIWASYNSTGPTDSITCLDHNGVPVVPNPIAALLPYDGNTFFTGVATWGDKPAGSFTDQGLVLKDRIAANVDDPRVLPLMDLAADHLIEFGRAQEDITGNTPIVHGFVFVSEVHANGQPSYPAAPISAWDTTDNACSPLGSWSHVGFAIDTGHAGPYPTKDVLNNVDPKKGIIVVNGNFVNRTGSTDPVGGDIGGDGVPYLNYTTGYSMDFSGTKVGIPYLNNYRASVGLPTNPAIIRMAALQVWCGSFIDWRDSSNFSKVVTIGADMKGRPAPLAGAASAFGTPTIRMDGNHLQFPINTGSGGSYTKEGTIVDYRPTPSY